VFYPETITEPKPAGFRQPFPEETCAVTADSTPDFVTAGFSYLFFVIFPVLSKTVSGLQCRKGVDLHGRLFLGWARGAARHNRGQRLLFQEDGFRIGFPG